MADKFSKLYPELDSPAGYAFSVTPADATVFAQPTRSLYVGGAGNIKVMMSNKDNANTVLTFTGVTAGSILPIRVQRVYSGNTTATSIIGLY
jgi:hypothetical protein